MRSRRTCRSAWRGRPRVDQLRGLAPGLLRHAQIGLAQPDPVPPAFDPDDERGIEYYTAWLIGEAAKA